MATTFTLNTAGVFPHGTEIKAYPVSNWVNSIVREDAAPVGAATNTQTVAGAAATFTGLTDGVRYVAHGTVNSLPRYMHFTVGQDLSQSDPASQAELNAHEADTTAVHGIADTSALALASSVTARDAVRKFIGEGSTQITTAAAAGSKYLLASGQANILATAGAGTVSVGAAGVVLVDPADHAMAGKTTKLALRVAILAGTAPTGTWTFGLSEVTIAAAALVPGAEPVTAAIATPAANTISRAASADVDLPAAGLYILTVSPSAIPAANVTVQAKALLHHV